MTYNLWTHRDLPKSWKRFRNDLYFVLEKYYIMVLHASVVRSLLCNPIHLLTLKIIFYCGNARRWWWIMMTAFSRLSLVVSLSFSTFAQMQTTERKWLFGNKCVICKTPIILWLMFNKRNRRRRTSLTWLRKYFKLSDQIVDKRFCFQVSTCNKNGRNNCSTWRINYKARGLFYRLREMKVDIWIFRAIMGQ